MLTNHFLSADERAELDLFRQSLERFCDAEIEPHYRDWERAGQVPRTLFTQMGAQGYLCADVPEPYGGAGASVHFSFAVTEVLARRGYGGLVGGVQVHNDVIPPYLLHCGTEAQRAHWLPRMASGEAIAAIGMTEPGAGSDLKAIRTTARREGDEYVINGAKTFISNGLNCDLIVVVAKTQPELGAKGVSLILVEADRAGFKKGRKLEKMGQEAADTAELFFEDVRVPASNLLGEENKGFAYLMQELAQERFIIAVGASTKLEVMLDETIRYTKERKVFGQTVFDFQNTRFKLAEIKARTTALRMMVDQYLAEHMRRKLTVEEAAIAKLYATEELGRSLDELLQLYGGYGYMMEYPIARAFVDSRVNRIYGGTSEVMKELISRKL